MKKFVVILASIIIFTFTDALCSEVSNVDFNQSDIKNRMIDESIKSYRRQCACPYQLRDNGMSCGKASGYNREPRFYNGAYPGTILCYETDITDAMIVAYKKKRTNY